MRRTAKAKRERRELLAMIGIFLLATPPACLWAFEMGKMLMGK